MDGQCFSCTETFGIFRREHGCKNCGYAFCSKCLNHSVILPGEGTKEQNVCSKCYKQLTAPPSDASRDTAGYQDFMAPPENFKKRIAALAAKSNDQSSAASSHTASSDASLSSKKRGLGKSEDMDIAERLERLKADRKKLRGRTLSTEEIEDRLDKLKGHPASSTSSGIKPVPPHQPPDQRTQHEETQDLLTQVKEEAAIDAKMDGTKITEESASIPAGDKEEDLEQEMEKLMQDAKDELQREEKGLERDAEIALKLAKLSTGNKTSEGGSKGSGQSEGMEVDDDEEDEEEATKRLIKQLLEQDRLEARMGALGYLGQENQPQQPTVSTQKPPSGGSAPDPDELPWCSICNEDAVLRCHGCDDDLYCKRCFREGHDGFDLKDHKTSNYKPPKGSPS